MPSSGLIHFYMATRALVTGRYIVSMPSSGLIHFYNHVRSIRHKGICVNALKRADSFLRYGSDRVLSTRFVSMPSSGLIHFYL